MLSIGVEYLPLPKWRNRQTRYVQGVVGVTPVWVQIPPSAPENRPTPSWGPGGYRSVTWRREEDYRRLPRPGPGTYSLSSGPTGSIVRPVITLG